MGDKPPRILITGFRAFPGAPYNPTEKLVERLMRLRRPAFDNIERISHIFPVTYGAIDRELPALIERHQPHALLMFGLASRTPHMRVETRARNTVTQIWPDADHTRVQGRTIVGGANDATSRFGPHTARLLRVAEETGVEVKSSLSAGYYLCNYLSWRAIEATEAKNGPRLAAFIHVPLVPRGIVSRRPSLRRRVTFEEMVDAGEAMLMEMARLVSRLRIADQFAARSHGYSEAKGH